MFQADDLHEAVSEPKVNGTSETLSFLNKYCILSERTDHYHKNIFNKLDANHDGLLTLTEVSQFIRAAVVKNR